MGQQLAKRPAQRARRVIYASAAPVKLDKLFLAYDVINGVAFTGGEFTSRVIGSTVKLDSPSTVRDDARREKQQSAFGFVSSARHMHILRLYVITLIKTIANASIW